jgi:hypothetical protein
MAELGVQCLLRGGALLIADSVSNIPVAPHTVA